MARISHHDRSMVLRIRYVANGGVHGYLGYRSSGNNVREGIGKVKFVGEE